MFTPLQVVELHRQQPGAFHPCVPATADSFIPQVAMPLAAPADPKDSAQPRR